jgi:phytanoyl-CoA hydroxylase
MTTTLAPTYEWNKDGFLVVEKVLGPNYVGDDGWIAQEIGALQDLIAPENVFIEERTHGNLPKQIQNLHTYNHKFFVNDIFSGLVLPKLKAYGLIPPGMRLESLVITNVQLFIKHAEQSGPTLAHQDDWYFTTLIKPTSHVAMTCWIALDDADETHGCLAYLPGSHKAQIDILAHTANVDGKWRKRSGVEGYAGYVKDAKLENMVAVPVRAGDMIVHDGRTLHCARPNTGHHIRRALTFILFVPRILV